MFFSVSLFADSHILIVAICCNRKSKKIRELFKTLNAKVMILDQIYTVDIPNKSWKI